MFKLEKINKNSKLYNKQGISLIIVTTALVIMLTLISVASLVGSNAIKGAHFDDYLSKLQRVLDDVNIYYIENNELPVKDLNSSSSIVSFSSLDPQLQSAIKENNDDTNTLYVVNTSLLKDSTIDLGSGSVANKDVFIVAEDSHNIYYLKGFKYNGKTYYSLQN